MVSGYCVKVKVETYFSFLLKINLGACSVESGLKVIFHWYDHLFIP